MMKRHAAVKEKIWALYDGELAGEARREAELHLKECAECRGFFERWNGAAKVLFRETQPVVSEFFVLRVMGRIAAARHPIRRAVPWSAYARWLVPAIGLAAAALFLIGRPEPAPVSVEALLLGDVSRPVSWALSNEPPTHEDLLGFALEGKA